MTTTSARQPAWELAKACARCVAGEVTAGDELARVARTIGDWDDALDMLHAHGLVPWLARALHVGAVDTTIAERIRREAARCAAGSLAQLHQLVRISRLFAQEGIVALPYKGPLLSLQLYGDAALRESTDLDIVVPREHFAAARRILVANGFPSRHGHSESRERLLFGWLGHAPFGTSDHFIELHWRFAPAQFPFALTVRDATARATPIVVGGTPLPMMDERDLIVLLAMHGTRHFFERLEWLAGFWRLVRNDRHSVSELLSHAASLRARRMLLVAVAMSTQALGATPGDEWRRAIALDGRAQRIARRMHDGVVAFSTRGIPFPDGIELQRLYGALVDGRVDGIRLMIAAALMPTEREWELVRLPDMLLSTYRVLRPLRLAGMYARRALMPRQGT